MYGSIFIQICAVGSKKRIFPAPECVLAVQGRSGSSKVDDFGTNRKRVYDFLLVRHCDYGPILHRFRDMVTYWPKIAYCCYIFATPLSFGPHDRSWSRFGMIPACDGQTVGRSDGQTDGRSDRIYHS